MKTYKEFSCFDRTVITFMIATCCVPWAFAGTSGAYMSSTGFGKAVDSVSYSNVLHKATSPNMFSPCAAVNPQSFICKTTTNLPPGTPSTVFCQSKGFPNYVWSIKASVTGGAKADNPELESRVFINPANCASVSVETSALFMDDYSGVITANLLATAGAAISLRGYEYFPAVPGQTPGSLDELKTNSVQLFDILLTGPFFLVDSNCTALTIPFTTQTGHTNMYFVADTLAASVPFTIACPNNVTFNCDQPLVYPEVEVTGGCGEVEVSYDPPAAALPIGASTVTVTATDSSGNLAQCSFTATRQGLQFSGFLEPIKGTGGSCTKPFYTGKLGKTIPVKFTLACGGSSLTTGTPLLVVKSCATGQFVNTINFAWAPPVWHVNWDTSGLAAGVYELIALLQDGSQKSVFIRLR